MCLKRREDQEWCLKGILGAEGNRILIQKGKHYSFIIMVQNNNKRKNLMDMS